MAKGKVWSAGNEKSRGAGNNGKESDLIDSAPADGLLNRVRASPRVRCRATDYGRTSLGSRGPPPLFPRIEPGVRPKQYGRRQFATSS